VPAHITSTTFPVAGRSTVVHAIPTGTVTIKECHHHGCLPERTPAPLRFLAILADRRFHDPMPIWTYAIEHPDGLFVVDAGGDPTWADPDTWAGHDGERRFVQSFIRLDVAEGGDLPSGLTAVGLHPGDVDTIVLTHQHVDHTASVPAFPDADVWTTRAEDQAARRIGALHWRWRPPSTRIRHVDAEGYRTDLGAAVDLTADQSLTAIHTPGHTPGSVSVRLRTDLGEVWFSGDTSFTAADMNPAAPTAGIHDDLHAVRSLQADLQGRFLLLPSHDPSVPERLVAASSGRSLI
jgi:glyoxylase-like metal-dependent hydrolase (beta-lactamase superfamily II)